MSRQTASGRTLARLWFGAILVLYGGTIALIWLDRGANTQSTWGSGGAVQNLLFVASTFTFPLVGLLIASRRPENGIGWIMLGIGTAWGIDGVLTGYSTYGLNVRDVPGAELALGFDQWLWLPAIGLTGTFLILLFPDGHLPSPRWRWFASVSAASLVVSSLAVLLTPGSLADAGYPNVRNPFGVTTLEALLDVLQVSIVLIPIGMLGSAAALISRFRRSNGVERLQLKWLASAGALVALWYAVVLSISLAYDSGSALPSWLAVLQDTTLFSFALIPIAIGFAILRRDLYDIDVVIGKTVVYGVLAAFITGVYVAIVVGVGALIGSGHRANPALSIIATTIVAVAFQPVRMRAQRFANRLVYGARATPYEILTRFSDRIAETYATEDVLPRTARILAEGTGSAHAEVWLRIGDRLDRAAAWPGGNGAGPGSIAMGGDGQLPALDGVDRAVPVRYRDDLLGAVTVAKPQGESLTPTEEKLLDDLASQAGLVLSNVRLTAELEDRLRQIASQATELRASRQRIVTAQDAERRRLERNIHDGAQQHLVALAVKLRLARSFVRSDPARAGAMLEELRKETSAALDTLVELSRGIYPPLLEEQGIAAALTAQYGRSIPPVHLEADGARRYAIELEAAVYFCCLEALQNVAKYANASWAKVRLADRNGWMTFEIEDDGDGFDPATAQKGAGTTNMADRLAALAGTIEIRSAPGEGTTVVGRIPVVPTEALG